MRIFFPLVLVGVLVSGVQAQDVRTRSTGEQQAQQPEGRRISGRVLGADNEPLVGATVQVINRSTGATITGTYSDANGNYVLSVPDPSVAVVRVSYINYTARDIPASSPDAAFAVTLAEDEATLNEVVVTAYGSLDRRDLTGSVANVAGEELAQQPTVGFDAALAGRAAGVQVTSNAGSIGAPTRVLIRGVNSINLSSEPLYVVDGVPIETQTSTAGSTYGYTNPLQNFNTQDIESIEFLKDGASSAIYGSRAANGVVLVRTRRGKIGKPIITYDGYYGWNSPYEDFGMLGAEDFRNIVGEMANNRRASGRTVGPAGFTGNPSDVDPNANYETDWFDIVYRTGAQTSHNVSASGGTEAVQYRVGFGYLSQLGIVTYNDLERGNVSLSVDARANKWLKVGTTLNASRFFNNDRISAGGFSTDFELGAYRLPPNEPYQSVDGPLGYNVAPNGRVGNFDNLTQPGLANSAAILAENQYQIQNIRLVGNTYAEINFFPWLTFRTQYGVDYSLVSNRVYWSQQVDPVAIGSGYALERQTNYYTWNLINTLTFNQEFDRHRISATAGVEYQKRRWSQIQGDNFGFSDPYFRFLNGSGLQTASGGRGGQSFDSYIGRLNYSFADKYLFGLSFRNDGLSSLAEDNRRGSFVGVSAGWRLSDEDFFNFEDVDLKLRASYGRVGNAGLTDFAYQSTVSSELYGDNNVITNTATADRNIKWETSDKYDVGVDFSFFDNRLTGSLDYFYTDINNLLLNVPTPPSQGIPGNAILTNVGSMTNQGVELSLTSVNIRRDDFEWTTTFNISTLRNEVTELVNEQDIFINTSIIRVGESLGSFYLYNWNGVNPANGNPQWRKNNGAIVEYNLRGQNWILASTGETITQSEALDPNVDRTAQGSALPKVYGGLGNRFSYKGFDFEFFLRYQFGGFVYNATRQNSFSSTEANNKHEEIKERWTTPGQTTDVPYLFYNTGISFTSFASTRFLEKSDFIRLQTITLGYTLPSQLLEPLGITRVRAYATGQNFLQWTAYSGVNPEADRDNEAILNGTNVSRNGSIGRDLYSSPLTQTIILGVQITF